MARESSFLNIIENPYLGQTSYNLNLIWIYWFIEYTFLYSPHHDLSSFFFRILIRQGRREQ
jgi:hypothetical protein